ncbi:hypothetical protein [Actinomadura hibisca]|uniref:hypothetical protein n=1 Tax=Actinomadura hibisca TaxID=68565 RepID=UPI000832E782|nr:hypothetical protein [Actinomadura hibisca]
MPEKSKVELYATIRRRAREGLSKRALQREFGVRFRTVQAALESTFPKPRKPRSNARAASASEPSRQYVALGCGPVYRGPAGIRREGIIAQVRMVERSPGFRLWTAASSTGRNIASVRLSR